MDIPQIPSARTGGSALRRSKGSNASPQNEDMMYIYTSIHLYMYIYIYIYIYVYMYIYVYV